MQSHCLKFYFNFLYFFSVVDRHKQHEIKFDDYEYLNLAGTEKQRKRRNDCDYLHLATGTVGNV